jgi:hypothetical protein
LVALDCPRLPTRFLQRHMTEKQRILIEALLRENRWTRDEIAARLGVQPASVSAVKAHMTMQSKSISEPAPPTNDLLRIIPTRRCGDETFHRNGTSLGLRLLDFWCWCNSDLLSNAARGRLAEYLVALDLEVADRVRSEWIAYDMKTPDGLMVEIKSASYIQTWAQRRDSIIMFDVRPTLGWEPDTAKFGVVRRRQSDAYVFALLQHRDRATIDPLNVEPMAVSCGCNACPRFGAWISKNCVTRGVASLKANSCRVWKHP